MALNRQTFFEKVANIAVIAGLHLWFGLRSDISLETQYLKNIKKRRYLSIEAESQRPMNTQ